MIPLRLFNWHANNGTLTAEISTLAANGHTFGNSLEIISHHSNKTEKFMIFEKVYNDDNDLELIKFVPINKSCKVKSVVIFND